MKLINQFGGITNYSRYYFSLQSPDYDFRGTYLSTSKKHNFAS